MVTDRIGNLRARLRRPLGRKARFGIFSTIAILCLLVLFQLAAPFLISSSLVRESMERAVAQWTGHDVTIAGKPDIRFWPEPRITLADITIRKQAEGRERVLGRIGRLSASFDLYRALRGRPEFKDFRLSRPEVFILRDLNGKLDWANDGLLSSAVRDAVADGKGQRLSTDLDARMGDVAIEDGSIELSDIASGHVSRLTSVKGTLDWPRLSQGGEFKANGQFNGHKVTLDVASTQPLLLLSGKNGDLTATLQSDLINGRFSGAANLETHAVVSGDAELTVPDLSAAMAWSGRNLAGVERLKNLSLSSHMVTDGNTLRFENLVLGLNEAKATGIVDLTLALGGRPRLSGTLAFDRMDFSALLASVAPRVIGVGSGNGALRRSLELDLRLSAQQAVLGPFQLSEAAVSIMNLRDQSRIDIVDSDFETGRLTGRINLIKGMSEGIALHLSVQDADFASISQRLGMTGPLPAARGSLDLALDIDRPLTPKSWWDAKGTVRFKSSGGVISGVDLAGIRQLAGQKPYFALNDAGKGSFEFQSMEISADLSGGSAEIKSGKIIGATDTLTLSGVIPYASNSMALSANVQPVATDSNFVRPLMVFVGGSWPNPVIWPISQTPANP